MTAISSRSRKNSATGSSLKGNVDPVNVLLGGRPEDARREAERLIRALARGSGYILSSACSVSPEAPAPRTYWRSPKRAWLSRPRLRKLYHDEPRAAKLGDPSLGQAGK